MGPKNRQKPGTQFLWALKEVVKTNGKVRSGAALQSKVVMLCKKVSQVKKKKLFWSNLQKNRQ